MNFGKNNLKMMDRNDNIILLILHLHNIITAESTIFEDYVASRTSFQVNANN